jgi:histidine triad (HIT) family protein
MRMADCLFCKIASKELDSEIVFESDDVLAFKDINPAAPVHVLVIPKEHVASAQELTADHASTLAEIFRAISSIAAEHGVENGYRVVTNVGRDAGQSVFHLHFHLIGGREMSWPPG